MAKIFGDLYDFVVDFRLFIRIILLRGKIMQDIFDFNKTLAVTAYLLNRTGGSLPCAKILTLLYLAERDFLLERGYSLTGDALYVCDEGFGLQITHSLLMGKDSQSTTWQLYIQTDATSPEKTVTVVNSPDMGYLSTANEKILDKILNRFNEFSSDNSFVEYLHNLNEWNAFYKNGTTTEITADELFSVNNQTDNIPFYRENVQVKNELNCLVNACGN